MKPASKLDEFAILDGIIPDYQDLVGQQKQISPDTKRALLQANGWQIDNDAMIAEALMELHANLNERNLPAEIICSSGQPMRLNTPKATNWMLALEGKEAAPLEGKANDAISIPALPSGIHQLFLEFEGSREVVQLIAAPEKAPSVFDKTGQEKNWGVNLALYGLHNNTDPGVGNYYHLGEAATAFASNGASFVGINPVHAMGWQNSEIISPYSPSHRGFLNTVHLAVDQIEPISDQSRALIAAWTEKCGNRSTEFVDYETHATFHRRILQSLFEDFIALATPSQKAAFQHYRDSEGDTVLQFARFECLAETNGSDWRKWPTNLRHCKSDDTSLDEKADFHIWMQWHAETQVYATQENAYASGMGLGLYLDLAVGPRRDGAEAWAQSESVAQGVSIGAPPDHLSPAGQNWNLAAYSPRKLAATNYQAFREILSRNMRRCGVLRIDHVLGLYRSFWIPDDGAPGGYIRQNFESLLAIVRIEAERNQTVVIGEDLGLVPNGLRAALLKSGIYSYSVLQYEKNRSGNFKKSSGLRVQSLACFGTHDTPTLKGFANGEDISWWQKLDWIDEEVALKSRKERTREIEELINLSVNKDRVVAIEATDDFQRLNRSVYSALADSPAAMISVQFDDIEATENAQNLPGTINEHPNWRRRAAIPVEAIVNHPSLKHIGEIMAESGRNGRMNEQEETAS